MADSHTFTARVRVPKTMWEAYEHVTERLGTDRSARLLDHIIRDIEEHGDAQDRADLTAGLEELAERRARKGGRPPKTKDI